MAFRLLCCDGGGIRGLITALLIQNLDESFNLSENADGFAGTSTGGLIALALANGIPIGDIIKIYETDGNQIFLPNHSFVEGTTHQPPGSDDNRNLTLFGSGPGVFSCQYKNDGLKVIVNSLFKARCLRDAQKYIAVNTAQLWDNRSWNGVTFSNSSKNAYGAVLTRDAALATSAAPTYFPPYQIADSGYFVDGGTFANNPSMSAITDLMVSGQVTSLQELRVLSLGTGYMRVGIPPSDIQHPLSWGALRWMWPFSYDIVPAAALLELVMAATSRAVTTEASNLLGKNFERANVMMDKPFDMDDWEDVGALVSITETYMESTEWNNTREWVAQNWLK